jgi:hydroxypyruvate isomerase
MPRFAANLSFLYPELPFPARFEAAAKDGFEAVEFLFPYAYRADELAACLRACGLTLALFNAPPGGFDDPVAIDAAWMAGDRGTAALPGRQLEFQAGVQLALRYAEALGCSQLHLLAGRVPEGLTGEYRHTYLANLRWAARLAADQGVSVLIEPINTRDMPAYALNTQMDAHAVLDEVDEPNLKVQMDLYHMQITEGDLSTKLRRYLPTGRVGHMQVAGVPDRHEPDVGELNHAHLFRLIDQLGYTGWVGCEYRPARGAVPGGTSAGLQWLQSLGNHLHGPTSSVDG